MNGKHTRRPRRPKGQVRQRTLRWAIAAIALMLLLPLAVDWWQLRVIERRLEAHLPRINRHAREQGLPPHLVIEVVRAESGGDPMAVSSAGARGLMQIMPATHEDLVVRFNIGSGDLHDPDYNLKLGTLYLRHLLDRFEGDITLALAAYHMGPTRVAKLRKEHPRLSSEELVARFAGPQTRAYVRRITAALEDHHRATMSP